MDCVSVKGKEQPIVVFELLGPLEETSEELSRFAELTTSVFQHYRARDFSEATASYAEAVRIQPDDLATTLLLNRCKELAASPRPEDWSGVMRLTSKSGE